MRRCSLICKLFTSTRTCSVKSMFFKIAHTICSVDYGFIT